MATIHRVIFTDQYQHKTPETKWHKSLKYCQEYIDNYNYKACLSIESVELIED